MQNIGRYHNVTIREIARQADTSVSTVSRVLRGLNYPVKEELRQRVLAVAQELNYQPNLLGRYLKSSGSSDIGVIIPNISNPFYSVLLIGIEQVLNENGLSMLLCNSFRDEEKEKRYVSLLRQKQVKGLIIASIASNHEYLSQHIREGLKVVTFDQAVQDIDCCRISMDYEKGCQLVMEYLFAKGHSKIGFMSAPLTRMNRKLIYGGYLKALRAAGLEAEAQWKYITDSEVEMNGEVYEFENGRKLARHFLKYKRRPTAVVVINDMTAYGVMHELAGRGIKIPDDLSIVSFDNIFFSQITTPALTTVSYSTYGMGRMAAEQLLETMQSPHTLRTNVLLAPQLVERQSVKQL